MSSEVPVGEPFQGPDTRAQIVIPVDKLGNVITGGGGSGGASGGAAASYLSPGNFAVAWTNATTLALTNLPFPPLQEQIVQVAEYDGDTLIAVYSQADPAFNFTWTPLADASAGTLEVDAATFTTGNQFVVQIAGPEPDSLDVLTDFGGPGVHQSPRDFDVVWASATTLTIGGVTPMAMDPDIEDIRAVVEVADGGRVRMTYTRSERDFAFTWAAGGAGAGTLTITGATLQNGSTFIVFVEGPEHNTSAANTARTVATVVKQTQNIGADGNPTPSAANAGVPIFTSTLLTGPASMPIPAGGAGMWSTGQGDFTAVFATIETLTLGAFPAALGTPISGSFFMVVESLAAGGQIVHVPTDFPMTLAAQILTVSGAGFINTSTFDVFCWGPPKNRDASVNGVQGVNLNPEHAWLANPILVETDNVTDGTVYYYLDFDMYKFGSLQVALDCDAGTVTATLEASDRDDGTAEDLSEYEDLGITPLVSSAAPASAMWLLDTASAFKRVRVKAVFNTGGNTGDITVLTREIV